MLLALPDRPLHSAEQILKHTFGVSVRVVAVAHGDRLIGSNGTGRLGESGLAQATAGEWCSNPQHSAALVVVLGMAFANVWVLGPCRAVWQLTLRHKLTLLWPMVD